MVSYPRHLAPPTTAIMAFDPPVGPARSAVIRPVPLSAGRGDLVGDLAHEHRRGPHPRTVGSGEAWLVGNAALSKKYAYQSSQILGEKNVRNHQPVVTG